MEGTIKLMLKWSGKEYGLELNEEDTVLDLKNEIEKQTGVKIERQKLLNLKFKGNVCVCMYFGATYLIFQGKTQKMNVN